MKTLILFFLLIGYSAICQNYTLHELPSKKPYAYPFGYVAHVPSEKKMPLLIALTGLGQRGNGRSDLGIVMKTGIGKLIAINKMPVDSFIVLLPQRASKLYDLKALNAFIKYALKTYNVDSNRVYITGLSAGAISAMNYMRSYSCTAMVLICGFGNIKDLCITEACKTPLWCFHGDQDKTVNVNGSINFVKAYNKCQHKEDALMHIYSGYDHNIWDITYANADVYTWLLTHRQNKPPSGTVQ